MNAPSRVTGIILAAGMGSRMGRTKQLLLFRGRTILECVIDNSLASRLQRVIVVLGFQADLVEPLVKGRDVAVVFNPLYESGQSSSLKSGLRAVTDDAEAVLFLLGDQPLVTPQTINTILSAYETSTTAPIVMPVYEGKRGNPVLFSRATFPRLESLQDDCGARQLFELYAGDIVTVPIADSSIVFDIDTEDDYRRLLLLENIG